MYLCSFIFGLISSLCKWESWQTLLGNQNQLLGSDLARNSVIYIMDTHPVRREASGERFTEGPGKLTTETYEFRIGEGHPLLPPVHLPLTLHSIRHISISRQTG